MAPLPTAIPRFFVLCFLKSYACWVRTGFVIGLVLSVGMLAAQPQDIPFRKELFPNKKQGYRKAVQSIKKGDFSIDIDQDYDLAIRYYEKAQRFNPQSAELNFKLGEAYYRSLSKDKNKSIPYFTRAATLNPEKALQNYGYLARVYHRAARWDSALYFYGELAGMATHERDKQWAASRIAACEKGKALAASPHQVAIQHLGKRLNSKFPDYGPVLSPDGNTLYFTSRKPGNTGDDLDADNLIFEDIYEAKKGAQEWNRVKNVGKPFNTNGHDGVLFADIRGKTLLLYKGSNQGDIYQSVLMGKVWSAPFPLPEPLNSRYRETSACLSPDGNTLYFVSDRPEQNAGGLDIYIAKRLPKNKGWETPKNIGHHINTPFDEDGVFMHPDGKTLYFSSKGHDGIGGYDFFKSVQTDTGWSAPVHLGYPLNSPEDDIYLVVTSDDHRAGFFSSARAGGIGDRDLYSFLWAEQPPMPQPVVVKIPEDSAPQPGQAPETPEPTQTQLHASPPPAEEAKPVPAKVGKLLALQLKVIDGTKNIPVVATATLVDLEDAQWLEATPHNKNGDILLNSQAGRKYMLTIQAPNYLLHTEQVNFPADVKMDSARKLVKLQPVKEGSKTVLNNLFFEANEATLQPASFFELDRVVAFMQENPLVNIEIGGHTDNTGTEALNLKLSADRAKAVKNYLVEKGIEPSRLFSRGYGSKFPVASNTQEEGRSKNRRTELRVVKTNP
jgi:outer membrane protein OmpA-like peptidoglycan-associated protein